MEAGRPVDPVARRGVRGERRELALQARDLRAQRAACGGLVDPLRDEGGSCETLRDPPSLLSGQSSLASRSRRVPPSRRTSTAPPRRASPRRRRRAPRTASIRRVRRVTPRPGAGSPNSGASGALASATTIRPAGSSSPSAPPPSRSSPSASRSPSGPSSVSASSAHTGTPVSTSAIVSASSSSPRERKPPCTSRSTPGRLDRHARDVGVEPDVAEEDAVGVRDRALAQHERVGAAEAHGERVEVLAHARRAAAQLRRGQLVRDEAEARQLGAQRLRDPAGLQARPAHSRAPAAAAGGPASSARTLRSSVPGVATSPASAVRITSPPR